MPKIAIRIVPILAALAILVIGRIATAAGESAALPGDTVVGSFVIAEKSVPLPPGAWQVLALGGRSMPQRNAGAPAFVRSAVLASLAGNAVGRLVVIRATAEATEGGWGIASDCQRSDVHFARLLSRPGSLIAVCAYVNHVLQAVSPDSARVWQEADRLARERGWTLPETWLVAGFRIADEDDLLDVRYYFNPDLLHLPPPVPPAAPAAAGWLASASGAAQASYAWLSDRIAGPAMQPDPRWAASAWSPGAVASDPPRAAVVQALVAWSGPALAALRGGFQNKMPALLADPPPWEAAAGEAEGGARPPPSTPADHTAAWKTLTWRAVGSGLDAVISYTFTGSVSISGAITVVGGAANAVAYYLHEIAWNTFGGARGKEPPIDDMPPTGIDR